MASSGSYSSKKNKTLQSTKTTLFPFPFNAFFFVIFFLVIPSVNSLQFSFNTFKPEDAGNSLIMSGNASIDTTGRIQLTRNPTTGNANLSKWNVGRATYFQPFRLFDDDGKLTDFSSHFSFVIVKSASSDLGQGLAFFLTPNGSSIPPGSTGGYLGVGSPTSNKNPFVAVEFDTYRNNDWEGTLPFNHIGILINSMSSVQNTTWTNNFIWERTYDSWITYDAGTKNLTVEFTSYGEDDTKQKKSIYYTVDLRDFLPQWVNFGFSASTSDVFETNSISSWEFSAAINTGKKKSINIGLVVGLSVGLIVFVVGFAFLGVFLWKKRGRRTEEGRNIVELEPTMDFPKKFSYGELARVTKNFSDEYKLGEGGFGGVYRGFLVELNCHVAIKRISRGSRQGTKEYVAEIKTISRLRHRNLVQLLGWCHEKGELLLVYEHLSNGSLNSHLYGEKGVLEWSSRYKIAKGLASALLYLHEEGDMCVLHRDIKPSNVLLDSDFNTKLGDFGLARLVGHERSSPTTDLAGTMGYMAIEYVMTQRATKESDVYSFGVVVLEIACGKKFNDFKSLDQSSHMITIVDWVWDLYGEGRILEAADEKLCGEFDEKEMECLLMVGLWSAHPDHSLRPSIRQAVLTLNFESPLPTLPETKPPVSGSFASRTGIFWYPSSSSNNTTASYGSRISSGAESSSYSNKNTSSTTTTAISIKSEASTTVKSYTSTSAITTHDTNPYSISSVKSSQLV